MTTEGRINIRLRLIIIQEGRLLVSYDSENDYYFYVGGKLEFGETIEEGIVREVHEELGDDATFDFKKILYIRDFISEKDSEHSVELFILGDINKGSELEEKKDKEFDGKKWVTWLDMNNLPSNLYPVKLTEKLLKDYKDGFPSQGEYVGKM